MEGLPPVDYEQLTTKSDLAMLRRDLETQVVVLQANLDSKLASQLRITVITHVGSMIGLTALVAGFT
jgi:hypothetical protein